MGAYAGAGSGYHPLPPATEAAAAAGWRGGPCARCVVGALMVAALMVTMMLLGGCWLQGGATLAFPPRGEFVTVEYGGDGLSHRILTRCSGPMDPSVPTIWVEVGGGGHSMSDLWGLEDYIVTNFNRR